MRAVQQVMVDLASSGLTPAQLALVMELSATVAAEARPVEDKAAQRRREKDRSYQAGRRQSRKISADSDDLPAPNERDNLTPTRNGKTEPKGSSKKRLPIPDDWQPVEFGKDTESRKVVDGWPPGERAAQLEQMKALHRSKGNTFLDPQDAWSTWVLNTRKFGIGRGQSSSNITGLRGSRPDPALDLLRAARAAEDREADRGAGTSLPAIGSG